MAQAHPNARLEAFCDGVFAIALTLLILDVRLADAESMTSNAEVWRALEHVAPAIFAFVLSFGIILITWVNHHAAMKLVARTSASFIYANGFLLLTVVFIPFPAALLGDFLGTDHAAPAVVMFNAVIAVQSLSWILVTGTALRNHLTADERSTATMRRNHRHGYGALALYSLLAVAALWLPLAVAVVTTGTWIFWLVFGIRMKHA